MRLDRSIADAPGRLPPVAALVALHWVALVVLPYLALAAWAGAGGDPAAWLERRCWGQPHVVWLGLANAGLLVAAAAELAGSLARPAGLVRRASGMLAVAGLAGAQAMLARWGDVARLLA